MVQRLSYKSFKATQLPDNGLLFCPVRPFLIILIQEWLNDKAVLENDM
jgi:hypothetical protein